jgi:hypothetical protein
MVRRNLAAQFCLTARLTLRSDLAAKSLKIQTMAFHTTVLGSASVINGLAPYHLKHVQYLSNKRMWTRVDFPRSLLPESAIEFRGKISVWGPG